MTITHVFVPLVKMEKRADGTLLVSGPATSAALDRDQQVCDPDWLDVAMPQWFGEGGNIREMHQPIAAGTALSYEKKADGKHWVEALVVDPGSVAKCEHGVLKGYSIGIKGARVVKSEIAPNGAIVDGAIIEVSLVDRPANPECMLQLAKSDDAGQIAPVAEQVLVEGPEAVAEVATPDEAPVVVEAPTVEVPEHVATADTVAAAQARAAQEEEETVEIAAEISTPTVPVPPAAAPMLAASAHVRAQAQQVMEVLSSLGVVKTEKADGESADITSAQAAIAAIARLIQSEAEGLANGELDEAYDIDCLLSAVSALRWFIEAERSEEKADTPDTVPAVQVAPAPEPATMSAEDASPLSVEKVQALIADALAEVKKSHEAETSALRDELAKVKAEPIPGGPVRVPTTTQKSLALDHDSRLILKAAMEYEDRAAATTDRVLAEGYRRLAEQERAKITR